MFRTPASICLRGPNDVFVPGLTIGSGLAAALKTCAAAEPMSPSWAAATVMPVAPRKRRRYRLMSFVVVSIGHLLGLCGQMGSCLLDSARCRRAYQGEPGYARRALGSPPIG